MAVFMAIVVVVGVFKCVWTATGLERGESSGTSTCVGELEHESTRGFR